MGAALLVRAGTWVDPEVQWFEKCEGPVEVQMAEVYAVDVVQQVTQQLSPFVASVPEVEAGLQGQQAGMAGDEVVCVMVNPGFPALKLPVGDQQSLLAQVHDATAVVGHPPQLPRADETAPTGADQGTVALVHLIQEGQNMQLAFHR